MKILVLLGFVICYLAVKANNIDSLYTKLKTEPNDSIKAQTLIFIGHHYKENDFYKAKIAYLEGLNICRQKHFIILEANIRLQLFDIYLQENKYEKAESSIKTALKIFEQYRKKNGIAWCYIKLGTLYYSTEKIQESLNYSYRALGIAKEINSAELAANSYLAISSIYNILQQYNLAETIIRSALNEARKANLNEETFNSYFSLSTVLINQGKFAEAQKNLVLAKNIAINANDLNKKFMTSNLLGYIYLENKNYSLAENYFKEALNFSKISSGNQGISSIYINLGKLKIQQQKYAEAIGYLNTALNCNDPVKFKANAYLYLGNIFNKQKQYAEALDYYKTFYALQDSLMGKKGLSSIIKTEAGLNDEIQRKEIEISKNDFKTQELNLQSEKTKLLFIVLSLILGGIALFTIISLRMQIKQKKLAQLTRENKLHEIELLEIEKKNTEAQYILLKNQANPLFLNKSLESLLHIIETRPEQSVTFVRNLSNVYRHILHNQNQTYISIKEEIDSMVAYEYLLRNSGHKNINIEIKIPIEKHYLNVSPMTFQIFIDKSIQRIQLRQAGHLNIFITIDDLDRLFMIQKINIDIGNNGLDDSINKLLVDIEPELENKKVIDTEFAHVEVIFLSQKLQ